MTRNILMKFAYKSVGKANHPIYDIDFGIFKEHFLRNQGRWKINITRISKEECLQQFHFSCLKVCYNNIMQGPILYRIYLIEYTL